MTTLPDQPPSALLLHRIDPALRRLTYVRTDAERLRQTPFLDGRTIFWEGEPEVVGFDEAPPAPAGAPERYIFHVSFCGSTLLASVLGEACGALVLKEPHCLVDLADWKKTLQNAQARDREFPSLLAFARSSLACPLGDGGPLVVKPTNWANNLLPELAAGSAGGRRLFVTMDPRAFVTAVFRGGRDRLAFTARVASHLASAFDGGAALVERAIAAGADPMARIATLASLALALQLRLFEGAGAAAARIDFADITSDLEGAVRRAAGLLDLEIREAALAAAVARWSGRDAKRAGASFSRDDRGQVDARIVREYGALIDDAVEWARRAAVPAPRPALAGPVEPGSGV